MALTSSSASKFRQDDANQSLARDDTPDPLIVTVLRRRSHGLDKLIRERFLNMLREGDAAVKIAEDGARKYKEGSGQKLSWG